MSKQIQESQATKAHIPELFQKVNWEGENTLGYKLKQIILRATDVVRSREIIGSRLDIKLDDVKIEHPKSDDYGDYSTNIAMAIAGRVGMKPRELAEKIAAELIKYIKIYQTRTEKTDSLSHQDGKKATLITKTEPKVVVEALESASVAGPGFINLTIRKDYLSTLLQRVLDDKNGFISSKTQIRNTHSPLLGKKIMVEFAHPNTHKEFHIGHLRNISIGESVVRILEGVGTQVFRANYEGDVGLHVAKAIWGVKKRIQNSEFRIQNLRGLNPANKAKFLGEGYALGSKMYEENEAVKKEIIELNKAIYKNPKNVELWEETRRWSLEYFDTIYNRLGSHFDRLYFESEIEAAGREIVKENIKTGIFILDTDGSIYFPGEKYGLNNCVFVTKENYATYEGKEIALEELQRKIFTYDLSINNVANEQQNFFQLGYKATELLFPWHKGRHFHLAYGMVNFKTGKLSSRTGQVVTAEWLIDQAKEKILKIMEKVSHKDTSDGGEAATSTPPRWRDQEIPPMVDVSDVAEKVAVTAVKYSMLKVNPRMDIAFDLEESVTFEGDSGPYLLYTYARCKSVLRKSKIKNQKSKIFNYQLPTTNYQLNTEELSLLRTFYRFPEVVIEAARNLSPNLICSYLFDLAQKYNLFYNKHSILTPEFSNQNSVVSNQIPTTENRKLITEFRLALTEATSIILKRGLYLLGIETVERM